MENCIHFWAGCYQKYTIFPKKLQIKVFWHRISDKKVREGICPSPSGVEVGARKMTQFKYEIVQKRKNTFTFGLNATKNIHYPKKILPWKIKCEQSLGVTFSVFCQRSCVSGGITCQNKKIIFFQFYDHFTYVPQYVRFQKRPNEPFTYEMPHI